MTAFSNIPPQAVLPLGAYRLDDLKRAAVRADQGLLLADFQGLADRDQVVDRLAGDFRLPGRAGKGLDALFECLTALRPPADAEHPGFLVVLQNLPDTPGFDAEQRDALLDVFRDAADHFFDRRTAFRVFYSVARRN